MHIVDFYFTENPIPLYVLNLWFLFYLDADNGCNRPCIREEEVSLSYWKK